MAALAAGFTAFLAPAGNGRPPPGDPRDAAVDIGNS
jgi:hypothetical protein